MNVRIKTRPCLRELIRWSGGVERVGRKRRRTPSGLQRRASVGKREWMSSACWSDDGTRSCSFRLAGEFHCTWGNTSASLAWAAELVWVKDPLATGRRRIRPDSPLRPAKAAARSLGGPAGAGHTPQNHNSISSLTSPLEGFFPFFGGYFEGNRAEIYEISQQEKGSGGRGLGECWSIEILTQPNLAVTPESDVFKDDFCQDVLWHNKRSWPTSPWPPARDQSAGWTSAGAQMVLHYRIWVSVHFLSARIPVLTAGLAGVFTWFAWSELCSAEDLIRGQISFLFQQPKLVAVHQRNLCYC